MLREALKQQLATIHERVEAKKLAKLALAEFRQLLSKEEEELELGRKETAARMKERVVTRLREEEVKMAEEEMEKTLQKLKNEKSKQLDATKEEGGGGEIKLKTGQVKIEKVEVGKGENQQDKGTEKESAKDKGKKSKGEKSDGEVRK